MIIMKILKFNIRASLLLMFFLPFLIVSCEKSNSIAVDNTVDQLFRPFSFTAAVSGNSIGFYWVPIANASYSVEYSKDSLLFTKELKVIPLDGVTIYSVKDLYSSTRYSARIKAISKDKTIKDSEYKSITFVTGIENIFYTVPTADIGKNQILIKWNSLKSVSQLVVSTAGVADVILPLSASDQTSGQKLVVNLTNITSYTFKIYNGDMLRGTMTVKTLP
jgi:hypothetical protein